MNAGSEPTLRLRGLHKSFRSGEATTPVLRGIDLEVHGGECFFIVGPSGCGKTTLLSIPCGTLRADSGTVRVLGQDSTALRESEVTQFRANHVGFVFQQFNLIPDPHRGGKRGRAAPASRTRKSGSPARRCRHLGTCRFGATDR